MRQDQWERLQQLEEKLTDIFIEEADPDKWPCPGSPSANLSPDDRKTRYLFKRAAAETAMLLVRTQGLIGSVQGLGTAPPAADDEESGEDMEATSLEKEIINSEQQAERMRRDLIARARRVAKADGQ